MFFLSEKVGHLTPTEIYLILFFIVMEEGIAMWPFLVVLELDV